MSRYADETDFAFLFLLKKIFEGSIFGQNTVDVFTTNAVDVHEVEMIGLELSQ